MAKKLFTVWLSLTILLFSSISICAEETVQAEYFNKNIVVNGENILNYQSDNPFILHKNLTYFPLNAEMGRILGFTWDINWESRTVTLTKTESTQKNFGQQWMKTNKNKIATEVLTDIKLNLVAEKKNPIASMVEGVVGTGDGNAQQPALTGVFEAGGSSSGAVETQDAFLDPLANTLANTITDTTSLGAIGTQVDLTSYDILTVGDVIYIPLGVMKTEPNFGWDIFFDTYSGIYLTTDGITPAQSTFNEAESKYNKGLAGYVMNYNKNYSVSQALNLVFLFKTEANIYKMDPLLLMAVAHKESTFTAGAKSGGGALGMMQVMPSTGARYGLKPSDLLDAHKNVEFGTLYLKDRIAAYNGDWIKALSAYNQGSVKVNRGGFSTRYANQVVLKYDKIKSFLTTNGYGLGVI